jgi:aminocarboxymuconate-semialdehyde decarboxylase
MTTTTADGLGDTLDIHAHHVDADALARMAALDPAHAPTLRSQDGAWFMDLPPGFFRTFPQGTTRSIPAGLIDPAVRLADMDRQGVRYHALSGYTYTNFYNLPGTLAAEFHAIHNDALVAACRAQPDRFVGVPSLPLQAPELAAAEVRRVAAFPETVGIGMGTNVGGMDLDDERLAPVWEAVNETGLPVLTHPPGIIAGSDRMRDYHIVNIVGNPVDTTVAMARIICSGMLDRYPNLRISFVHGGGFGPYQIGRWDHAWHARDDTSARTDRPPSAYVPGRIFVDSLTHHPRSLAFLGDQVGWDQVMMGTDYPWDMATTTPLEDLLEAALEGDRLRAVATDNARAFLRWPGDRA